MSISRKLSNMTVVIVFTAAACIVTSPMAQANTQSTQTADSQASSQNTLTFAYVMHQYAIDQALAPIKTRNDLRQYLKSHKTNSPFDKFTPINRRLFLKSLKFGNGGVSNFRYDVFADMSPTDVYKILALFGDQVVVPHLPLHSATVLDREIMSPNVKGDPFLEHYECTGTNSGSCIKDTNQLCNTATC